MLYSIKYEERTIDTRQQVPAMQLQPTIQDNILEFLVLVQSFSTGLINCK